jgi:hypothetical protein
MPFCLHKKPITLIYQDQRGSSSFLNDGSRFAFRIDICPACAILVAVRMETTLHRENAQQ